MQEPLLEPKPQKPEKGEQKKQPKTSFEKKPGSLIVRSELNLEQNSIFTVSTYRKKSREITIREVVPTGEVSERKAIIGKTIDGLETGVLTTHHFKVYLALLELWEKAGRLIDGTVRFTTLRIMKRLGMQDSGEEYERLKKWLYHLRQIPIEFRSSFFIPKEATYRSFEPFTILSYLDIYERDYQIKTKTQKTRGYGEFQFDRHILANLLANYSHPLRLDVVKEFKKHKDTAILLYTYLDRCLAFKDKYEINLEKLFEHLDLSQGYIKYPSERKKQLQPVLKELEGKPLSTGALSYCRIHKTEDAKDYKLVARKKAFERLLEAETEKQAQLIDPTQDLISKLRAKGLTESQARGLFDLWGEKTIRNQLEIFPFRLSWYKMKGVEVRNPSALLYMMIKGNWTPPPNYLEEKAIERRAKKRREAQERAKERERLEQEKRQRHYEELNQYYLSLSPEKRQEIDQEVWATLYSFTKEWIQKERLAGRDPMRSPFVEAALKSRRYEILEKLKTQQKA